MDVSGGVKFILAALIVACLPATAQQAHYQKHDTALLPDDQVTAGVVALTDSAKVCATKWGTDERFVTGR